MELLLHTHLVVGKHLGALPTGSQQRRLWLPLCWVSCLLSCLFFSRFSIQCESPNSRYGVFFALCLLLLSSLVSVSVSDDLFNIYVFLEISALASYALTAFTRNKAGALSAFRYLIIGTIGSALFLLGVAYLYFLTGTLNLSEMHTILALSYQPTTVYVGMLLITLGLILKAAIFPLHQWLVSVYTYAPLVIVALFSATSTKVILFLWLRLFVTVFELSPLLKNIPLDTLLIVLASIGILWGSLLAIRQNDIKTMFAYSSIAQVGYILLAFALLSENSVTAGLIYLWNHAFH